MIIRSSRSLFWINDENLLIYKKGFFYTFNCLTNKKSFFCKMPMKKSYKFFSFFNLFNRLLRVFPQSPVFNNFTNEIYFSFLGSIYSLNISNKCISHEIKLQHNASRVLSICVCNGGDIVFGEYPTKEDNAIVSIYRKKLNSSWEIVYSFPNKSIRHIHRLVCCENDLYCFTGDEDLETQIIKFKNFDFDNPKILLSNCQKYRSCFALVLNGEIIYFSDTPYLTNKIYSYNEINQQLTELCEINGTVIYGLIDGSDIYFSTVVEKNLKKDTKNRNISIKINGRDGGIKSKSSTVYIFNKSRLLMPIISLKKDVLPPGLFGVGTFVFTANCSKKYISFSVSGLKKDGCTFVLEKESVFR